MREYKFHKFQLYSLIHGGKNIGRRVGIMNWSNQAQPLT